ncbi:TPA: DNA cytosine methyltransferase [Yersinia enterocolitica]
MTTIINSKIGENKGNLRIWLEGGKLSRNGFQPNDTYSIITNDDSIIITKCNDGEYSVSRRMKGERADPVIEVTSVRCKSMINFFEQDQLIRVVVTSQKIVITSHHLRNRIKQREETFLNKINVSETMNVCELFYGYGVLARSAHDGFKSNGIKLKNSVIVERERKYIDASIEMNPDMFDAESIIIESAIQDVDIKNKMKVDLLFAGIPCTGASKSGRTKNKLASAEEHPDAGSMFFYFLKFLESSNPAAFVIENVCEYLNTESMAVIRSVANHLGYALHEVIIDSRDYGSIEERKRMLVIGVSVGLTNVVSYFDDEIAFYKKECIQTLNDIFEPIADDHTAWKEYSYLADKEIRDLKAGKGFKRQLLTGDNNKCGTIGRGYHKGRSTEPFIKHPTNPHLSRLLTPVEHARVKDFPEKYLNPRLSNTLTHEVLGQGVVYSAFYAAFAALAKSMIKALKGQPYLLKVA